MSGYSEERRAQDAKETREGCIGWLAVMTVATLAGFLIGYLAQ